MGIAITTIIANCQIRFSDISSATALNFINEINTELQQYLPLNAESTIPILPQAGIGEYSYPNNVYLIKAVNYQQGLSTVDATIVVPTNTSKLDAQTGGTWRYTNDPGAPVYFYTDGLSGMIGFWPIPDTTAVGIGTSAVPLINLFVSTINANTYGLSDVIQGNINSDKIFVYGVCKLFAEAYHPEKIAQYTQSYATEWRRLMDFANSINLYDLPTVAFKPPTIKRG